MKNGDFPDDLKIGRVCPIFKSGDASDLINYIPNFILPMRSKVFESVFYIRIIDFLLKYDNLQLNQDGFLKKQKQNYCHFWIY